MQCSMWQSKFEEFKTSNETWNSSIPGELEVA